MSEADAGQAVPPAQRAGWLSFVKSIASFSGDLSAMTAPSFILSPTSLTEFPSYFGEPTAYFAAISKGKSEEEVLLLALEWFIQTLPPQFTKRERDTGSEKKPLNPILGEQFIGKWDEADTKLAAEQVSHHPPITAYHLESAAAGVSFDGHCAQKTSFSARTITVKQVGHGLLRVRSGEEERKVLVTLPKLKIEGLLYGSPYVELTEASYLVSDGPEGWVAVIDFKGAGWVRGSKNSFKATVHRSGLKGPVAYIIEGQWTGVSTFTTADSKVATLPHTKGDVFTDTSVGKTAPIHVDEANMGEWESRRIWKDVAGGIRSGDFEKASAAKSKIEVSQREARKKEHDEGKSWQLQLFKKVADDPDYHKLSKLVNHSPANEESYTYLQK